MDDFFRFLCPTCGKRLKAKPEHTGKKAHCNRCGTHFVVPIRNSRASETASPASKDDAAGMDVLCPSCQLRLSIPDKYAGQSMKCPMCGDAFTAPALHPMSAPIACASPAELPSPSGEPSPSAPRNGPLFAEAGIRAFERRLVPVAKVVAWLAGVFALLLLGQTWHVAGNENEKGVHEMVRMLGKAHLFRLIDQSEPRVVFKDRVGAWDAIMNLVCVLALALSVIVMMLVLAVLAICLFLGGVLTANWDWLLGAIMCALAAVLAILVPPILWLVLIFQAGTPAYYLLWLLVGLPAMGAGEYSNVIVLRNVNVIIFKN